MDMTSYPDPTTILYSIFSIFRSNLSATSTTTSLRDRKIHLWTPPHEFLPSDSLVWIFGISIKATHTFQSLPLNSTPMRPASVTSTPQKPVSVKSTPQRSASVKSTPLKAMTTATPIKATPLKLSAFKQTPSKPTPAKMTPAKPTPAKNLSADYLSLKSAPSALTYQDVSTINVYMDQELDIMQEELIPIEASFTQEPEEKRTESISINEFYRPLACISLTRLQRVSEEKQTPFLVILIHLLILTFLELRVFKCRNCGHWNLDVKLWRIILKMPEDP
ncbi:hypothetical protein BC829DRAFT_285064 [Chytridium lagenaria]|nr:hypothetical protein BC829DRAFT_285064 [Chytridium lagenaria]